jgi:DNA-binding NarL/FixJ family response regulator
MLDLGRLVALIIDPNGNMRSSMHNMLNLCGITKIDHASSASTTIRSLQHKVYDLILCEYDLGVGQDGQQLLEDLRHHQILPLSTVFVMVTAERAYEKVVGAAELGPTDYILKPFTADTLLERVKRAMEKRSAFMPVYQLLDQGYQQEAIAACVEGEANYRRYATEFMRLRAELHMSLGQAAEAQEIYRHLHETRAIAWARLGLAKTLFMQERYEEAALELEALVADNTKFLDAYDWLAKAHEASGQLAQAKAVLEDAVVVSPHAVRRLRRLGEVALESGDVETAERSLKQVVNKAKYSEFRDPEDNVRLVKSLIMKGDAVQAAAVIRDFEKSMNGMSKTAACSAISSAMVHEFNGDAARLTESLNAAVAACRETSGMSGDLKMELARNCLQNSQEEAASEVMLDVMRNSANEALVAKAMRVFEQAGRVELGEDLAKQSRRQVFDMVADGAQKARSGDYQGAVTLMTEAVKKMPDNPQVNFNAALALLKYLENIGWDDKLGKQARTLIDSARRLEPANPRLSALAALYQEMLVKHGSRTGISR